MRLIFIRHCEPDYSIDSLTQKGFREAALLADRVQHWDVEQFYCSPLGRARDTARPSLARLHREAIVYDWLQEFSYRMKDPTTGKIHVPWDYMPEYWTKQDAFYDHRGWMNHPVFLANPEIGPAYEEACRGIDTLLARYGYTREEEVYLADPVLTADDDDKTIVFFCHLGISLVLIGHLLGIAPIQLQQCFYLPPSSVTILNAEKRLHDVAFFRVQVMGDTTHLRIGGEPVSEMGAFSRVFSS
ncbi:MAG: histidine phosphatase family protein [Eubacteriales bacterium]|nr:histidine phosphatase family protein [Eubacteriales bacterium]